MIKAMLSVTPSVKNGGLCQRAFRVIRPCTARSTWFGGWVGPGVAYHLEQSSFDLTFHEYEKFARRANTVGTVKYSLIGQNRFPGFE